MTTLRRPLLAAFAGMLLAPSARAEGRDATPAGFTGRVFITEGGGVRIHTHMASAQGGSSPRT